MAATVCAGGWITADVSFTWPSSAWPTGAALGTIGLVGAGATNKIILGLDVQFQFILLIIFLSLLKPL